LQIIKLDFLYSVIKSLFSLSANRTVRYDLDAVMARMKWFFQ